MRAVCEPGGWDWDCVLDWAWGWSHGFGVNGDAEHGSELQEGASIFCRVGCFWRVKEWRKSADRERVHRGFVFGVFGFYGPGDVNNFFPMPNIGWLGTVHAVFRIQSRILQFVFNGRSVISGRPHEWFPKTANTALHRESKISVNLPPPPGTIPIQGRKV
jgi:hypothetical protein